MCVCVCVYPRWGDRPVALKSCRVPDLGFDGVLVQLNRPGAELHTDGGATVVVELIFGEARQEVTLPNPGLSYQNHWTEAQIGIFSTEQSPVTQIFQILGDKAVNLLEEVNWTLKIRVGIYFFGGG